jgi:hypothetical protein
MMGSGSRCGSGRCGSGPTVGRAGSPLSPQAHSAGLAIACKGCKGCTSRILLVTSETTHVSQLIRWTVSSPANKRCAIRTTHRTCERQTLGAIRSTGRSLAGDYAEARWGGRVAGLSDIHVLEKENCARELHALGSDAETSGHRLLYVDRRAAGHRLQLTVQSLPLAEHSVTGRETRSPCPVDRRCLLKARPM